MPWAPAFSGMTTGWDFKSATLFLYVVEVLVASADLPVSHRAAPRIAARLLRASSSVGSRASAQSMLASASSILPR